MFDFNDYVTLDLIELRKLIKKEIEARRGIEELRADVIGCTIEQLWAADRRTKYECMLVFQERTIQPAPVEGSISREAARQAAHSVSYKGTFSHDVVTACLIDIKESRKTNISSGV